MVHLQYHGYKGVGERNLETIRYADTVLSTNDPVHR